MVSEVEFYTSDLLWHLIQMNCGVLQRCIIDYVYQIIITINLPYKTIII